jgi:hypothetical protein
MFTTTRKPVPSRGAAGRLTRTLVAAGLCATFVAAVPAPAQAQTLTDPDAVGDMAEFSGESPVPAPGRTLNDITSTRLSHGATRISLRVDYVDLQKVGEQYLYLGMVTNEGVRRELYVYASRGAWSGEVDMMNGRGREVRCAVRHSIDYDANVMKVSFPRRCASNPRWVKFRAGALVMTRNRFYLDDALRDRPINKRDQNFALSGRVHRVAAG